MATSAGFTGGARTGVYDPYTQGSGGFGYNGQQYPDMGSAQQAQNPEAGSKEATANAQQAVLGLNQALSPASSNSGYTYAGGSPAPRPGAAPQASGSFQAPGGGVFTTAGAGSAYNVDTEGNTSYSVTPNLIPQEAAVNSESAKAANDYAMQQAAQKAQLGDASFKNRLSLLGPLVGNQTPSPYVQYGQGGGEQAVRDAAFARAKEQAGQTALAGLQSLNQNVENRGLMGSSFEAQGLGNVIGKAGGGVNAFTREQLINDLNRSAQVADTQYQGNITQRGQDMQRQQALISLMNSVGGLY